MNSLFYLTVFAICFAAICGSGSTVAAAPLLAAFENKNLSHESSNRVVRQVPPLGKDIPPPPDFPPQVRPNKFDDNFSRIKREAKGVGGSIPTRKG
ncbi:unnamed protein product [Arctia plantaginis]|uniref:Uncharacterized protein n=1 Tax=Arctia plantaginis TaxID=874455 RepID=A0A8S1B2A1_ARCPL|nr:unnamed protein product [Arctia plantaginis]CAB3253547.1 unnamed protein product [Arctia plantaginis]